VSLREIANEMSGNAAEERKSEQQLVGFRAVYAFDRLSRFADFRIARNPGAIAIWRIINADIQTSHSTFS
jgi:hypothetical protein